MEHVLNYIMESSLTLGVLIILYRFLLRNLNNLILNRFYIASSMIFAAILPFIHLSVKVNSTPNMLPGVAIGGQGPNMLEAITIYAERTNQAMIGAIRDLPWMQYIYIIGIVLLIIRLMIGFYKLHLFKKRSELIRFPGYLLVNTSSNLEPFSFFGLLFINRNKYNEDEYDAIVHHELAHIQLKHSFDNLLLEFILIIQWFNPFAWMLRRDLKEIHEYQADRQTISTGVNPKFYKELLLGNAMGTRIALGNNLNQLLIKKRLKMINNRISKSPGLIRSLAVAAVLGLLVFVFACERDDQNIYNEVDVMPEYPGGIAALKATISENLEYPKYAKYYGIEGEVTVSFVVTKDGLVSDAQIEKGVDSLLDVEALRVVKLLTDWKPGVKDGENVNVQFSIPISFKMPEEEVFIIVEDMPQFDDGPNGVQHYIMKNILYPEKAKENGIEGEAYVSFNVGIDCKVKDVKIARSSGNDELDAEAIRVVASMPDWNKPGIQRGKPVEVNYIIPVKFLMTDKGGAMVIDESTVNPSEMLLDIDTKEDNGKIHVNGKITDEKGKPLPGASIIIKGTSVGTVADTKGMFSLTLENENQKLEVSYIGKKNIVWNK